ncbi:hypothetical protein ACWGJP_07705 [Microbacterium sp. NPDC055903]
MTNETPESPLASNAGQHAFGATFSSARVSGEQEPAAAATSVPVAPDAVATPDAAEASGSASSAAPAVAPETTGQVPDAAQPSAPSVLDAAAAPDSVPAPEVVQPAPEVVQPAPEVTAPAAFTAPGGYPAGEAAVAYHADPSAVGHPAQPATGYPGAQPEPQYAATAAYPGTAGYPGAAGYPGPETAAYPTGAYDPNAGQYPAPAPSKPISKGLIWGLVGGGAALILLIVAAIAVPLALRGPQVTAGDAVESYLTALQDGDAEAALEYVDSYGNTDLLTDEVLQASLDLAPISDIVIGEFDEDRYSATVPVTFSLGGQPIEREFDVYKYDDDWVIVDAVVSVYTVSGFEGLGLTVNGAEPPADEGFDVFPGTYAFELASDAFALEGGEPVVTIADADDAEELWELSPVLSESGSATFKTLVTDAINECVAMKTLSTPCGWDISDIDLSGATPIEGTVTRTLTDDGAATLADLTPEYYSGTTVTSYDSISVDMTLEGESDGQRATYEVWWGGYMGTPVVDFSTETPTLTWE